MAYVFQTLLLMYGVIGLSKAYYAPEFPGPFCGIDNRCCKDRKDECSHPIAGTRCYCDEFCKGDNHDDCCPDYEPVCKGSPVPEPPPSSPLPPPDTSPIPVLPPQPLTKACSYGNQHYAPGESRTKGCNNCTCNVINDQAFWECEQDECMIEDYIIGLVNNDHLSWRATNYSQFYSKKLKEGLKYKLGTFPLGSQLSRLGAVHYKKYSYPDNFDGRVAWRNVITPIMDQGWCGSDWAVSLASTISDRYGVQSNGIEKVRLSPQTLLSCNKQRQQGCEGGHIDTAWMFASYHGLVDESCFPYKAQKTVCPLNPYGNLLSDGCTPSLRERRERYKVGPPSRLIREADIMYDLINSGPVQAIMKVHQDFFHYKGGIYRRSGHGDNNMSGYHTVKVVGWGKDKGDLYWIVANSWGPEWGEDGYFRIARGVNESGIESFMVSVLCYVTEVFENQ